MFDNVLSGKDVPRRSWGSGTITAVIAYVLVAGFALWASARPVVHQAQDVVVKFVRPPPPPPPPAPPAPPKARPKPVRKAESAMVLQQAIVAPKEIPTAKPKESEVLKDDIARDLGGYGDVGNVAGGIRGSVIDATDASGPVEFNESMTRPEYLTGPSPEYTQKALEKEVEGLMVVKCVVGADGHVADCRVMKSLPYMDKAVISALEHRRYKPATFKGKAITVDYTFRINMTLPQ